MRLASVLVGDFVTHPGDGEFDDFDAATSLSDPPTALGDRARSRKGMKFLGDCFRAFLLLVLRVLHRSLLLLRVGLNSRNTLVRQQCAVILAGDYSNGSYLLNGVTLGLSKYVVRCRDRQVNEIVLWHFVKRPRKREVKLHNPEFSALARRVRVQDLAAGCPPIKAQHAFIGI
ncbi:hypothetical protein [Trinickia soli]|uniref:hypothetical protein n=1 Tax=Trinickia soli TaxID=380675 RepID=UPI001E55F644|nr:hypothetical protein [Trinickia soli]